MKILLTNDDGIEAAGLHATYRAIADLGEIHVVAPSRVQSATGHAITLHRSISVDEYKCDLFEGYAVDGRPADCVKLAIRHLIGEVDLVVSGTNHGANIGVNVHYSGTVGAAREAAFKGFPAIALSLHLGNFDHDHWPRAAKHARRALDAILEAGLNAGEMVNVNVPILDGGAEPVGMRVVPLNMSPMNDQFEVVKEPDGRIHFDAKGSMAFTDRGDGTDVDSLFARFITLTPLHYEQTDEAALQRLRGSI